MYIFQELATLRKEVEEFQKQRTEELERVQTFKDEELRKLKRERKMFEKYQKEARTIPNKKDRDEIESLKTQVWLFFSGASETNQIIFVELGPV